MKLLFIILCRFDSNRLPGKILMEIEGKPILRHIYDRLLLCAEPQQIVVATSERPQDDPIFHYSSENNIQCFRGSFKNVAQRFLDCAKLHHADYIARINGDNFFVPTAVINEMSDAAKSRSYDFLTNVKNRTFPKGMSVEMVRTVFYENQYRQFHRGDHFEHVTLYLYENQPKNSFFLYNRAYPQAAGLPLAIDDEADFARVSEIYHRLKTEDLAVTLKNICLLYNEMKSEHF